MTCPCTNLIFLQASKHILIENISMILEPLTERFFVFPCIFIVSIHRLMLMICTWYIFEQRLFLLLFLLFLVYAGFMLTSFGNYFYISDTKRGHTILSETIWNSILGVTVLWSFIMAVFVNQSWLIYKHRHYKWS